MKLNHSHHPAAAVIAMRPGLTYQELGRSVGAHPDVVSRVVRGVQPGSRRLKQAIADALGEDVGTLFYDATPHEVAS